MWYLIADANGLSSGSTLTTGQVLTIPNKVTNIHNNAGTFRPYNPGEAIGDTSPTLPVAPSPPKKKKKCGGFLAIIVAVIAVVATVYTAGAFAAAVAPAATIGASGAAIGTAGAFAAGTAALSGGIVGLGAGTAFGIAAVAGAVGSIAGQLAGLALGVQDKFSWSAVAAGAIGAGIGASGALGSIAGGNVVGQAIAGNIINQGVGIITGAQKGFSWAGVAAAAIAAPITSSIGKSIKDSNFGGAGNAGYALRGALTGVATSTVNELTRVAIVGGKVNWSSVAIGGISGGIYGYGEGLGQQARVNSARQSSAQADEAYRRLTSVRPDGKSPWGGSYNVASTGGGVAMRESAGLGGDAFAEDFELRKKQAAEDAINNAANKVMDEKEYIKRWVTNPQTGIAEQIELRPIYKDGSSLPRYVPVQDAPTGYQYDGMSFGLERRSFSPDYYGKDYFLEQTINSAVVGSPFTGKTNPLLASIQYSLIDNLYPANAYQQLLGMGIGYAVGKTAYLGINYLSKTLPAQRFVQRYEGLVQSVNKDLDFGHIMGEVKFINGKVSSTGGHIQDSRYIQYPLGSEVMTFSNGVTKGKIEIKGADGRFYEKTNNKGLSTLTPVEWSNLESQGRFAEAFMNKAPVTATEFRGSSGGVEFKFFLKNDGKWGGYPVEPKVVK
jgi:hypothetical protein